MKVSLYLNNYCWKAIDVQMAVLEFAPILSGNS